MLVASNGLLAAAAYARPQPRGTVLRHLGVFSPGNGKDQFPSSMLLPADRVIE